MSALRRLEQEGLCKFKAAVVCRASFKVPRYVVCGFSDKTLALLGTQGLVPREDFAR